MLKELERKYRRIIATNEIKTKIHNKQVYVWIAKDVDTSLRSKNIIYKKCFKC